jgi:hypothetical protein
MQNREAERWLLRAEEYRAIGSGMALNASRGSYEAMAEQCERVARQLVTPPPRHLSATDCLGYAQQCEALARRLASKAARERVLDIAEQWRKLAQWGDPL